MNILKKLLAAIAILWLFGQMTVSSFAYSDNNWKLNYAKENIINDIKWWEKIIKKVDTFVARINESQAKKLQVKLEKIKDKFSSKAIQEWWKEEKILLIIRYIELKIEDKIKKVSQADLLSEYSQTLSIAENKKINTELVKIQKNILNNGTHYLEKIMWEFEKYSNYQEKGNFKAHVNIDHEMVGKIKAELKLSNYEVNNSSFDTQLKTKVSAMIDTAPRWGDAVKGEIAWFIDFISKDQNYYLLLKELKISDEEWIEEFKLFIEKIKQIAATNKYIHFEDKSGARAMEILKNFSPKNILTEWNQIVSKPLFKAYKKQWEKYYLIPTKYACDTAKQLANKFDPFNGKDCTQGQYEDMIKDISDSKVEVYIELGKNTTIWFNADKSEGKKLEQFNGSVSFSNNYIEEIKFTIKPNQTKNPNEWAEISYKRNNSLNAYVYADKWKIDVTLTSSLDRNNNFKLIDLSVKAEEFTWNLVLKNKKISGKYSLEDKTVKWNWNISGRMDNTNRLSELKVTSDFVSTSEYYPYKDNSRFEYNKWQIVFANDFSSDWTKANLDIWASRNPSKKELVAWNFSLDVLTKESSYDYDTYKTTYTGDFEKVFESDITLKNKAIEWKTIARKNGKVLLRVAHSGKYEKNYLKLNNKFSSAMYSFLFGKDSDITWNFNIAIDQRSNKNNWNLFIDINLDTKQILEFEIDNKSTKTYKNIDIKAPTNTVELETIIETPEYKY